MREGDDEHESQQQHPGERDLLVELVAEVPLPVTDGGQQASGKLKEAVILRGQPAAALLVEIVGLLYLLVLDESIGQVMEMHALIKELHLQHTVKTAHRGVAHHRIVKQGIVKSHARTYQSRRHAQIGMPRTENGVVYLLADCVQIGHVGVQVLGHAMRLHHPDTGHGESVVHLGRTGR